jgi:hypothetical protein
VLDKFVSDLVGPSVTGAAACFAVGAEETMPQADIVFCHPEGTP